MFGISALSGSVATLLTHPFDFLKTKIQIYNEGIGLTGRGVTMGYNMYRVFTNFHERGYGSRVLYTGLGESLLSRMSYLAVRNTFYKIIYDMKKPNKIRNDLTHREKSVIAGIAGAMGAIVSNGFECQMVRKIGNVGRESKYQRKNISYNLQSGLAANVMRAVLLNGFMIYPYDNMKERMQATFGDCFLNRIVGVISAAIMATAIVLPLDNLKTRYQNQYPTKSLNRLNYTSKLSFDIGRIVYHEGYLTFYAGLYPFFLRTFIYGLSVR